MLEFAHGHCDVPQEDFSAAYSMLAAVTNQEPGGFGTFARLDTDINHKLISSINVSPRKSQFNAIRILEYADRKTVMEQQPNTFRTKA